MRAGITLTFIIGLCISTFSQGAPGLPGHRHLHSHDDALTHERPIDKQHAMEMAHEVVTKLANLRKIDESWISVNAKEVEKKTYSSGLEWVVLFENPRLENRNKHNLYVFLTMEGKYIAANYSGN